MLARLKKARKDLEDHYQTEAKRLDAMIQAIESGEQAGDKSVDDSTGDAEPVKGDAQVIRSRGGQHGQG